jgi:hypothetical protein
MFQLDLGQLALALIGAPDHRLLDSLVAEKGAGAPLCREILAHHGVDFRGLMLHDAPAENKAMPAGVTPRATPRPVFVPPKAAEAAPTPAPEKAGAAAILDAASAISGRGGKGGGRVAECLSRQLGVSASTIYQARSILRYGSAELIAQVRSGEIGIKKAAKGLKIKEEE